MKEKQKGMNNEKTDTNDIIQGEVKHQKCPKCKSYRMMPEFLNDKGRRLKTCKICRDRGIIYRDKYKNIFTGRVKNIAEKK